MFALRTGFEKAEDLAVLREARLHLLREDELAVDEDVELPALAGRRDRVDVQ